MSYTINKHHSKIEDIKIFPPTQFGNITLMSIALKLETNDGFIAQNPIDVTVVSESNFDRIKEIQIEFEGAVKYFPGDYNPFDPNYWKNFSEEVSRNVIILNGKINPFTNITTFPQGQLKNLVYNTGGDYDIKVTLIKEDGTVIGSGVGDDRFDKKDAIHISPPEVLQTIKSNNIMAGLGYLAIGVALFISGLNWLMKIIYDLIH